MNTESRRVTHFRRIALFGVLLALCVIVMGAWVRLSDAGLGCPDWPGCYGHFTAGSAAENADAVNAAFPHRPVEYHKAVKEMVHRYFATSLGVLSLILAAWAFANRSDPDQPVVLPVGRSPLFVEADDRGIALWQSLQDGLRGDQHRHLGIFENVFEP